MLILFHTLAKCFIPEPVDGQCPGIDPIDGKLLQVSHQHLVAQNSDVGCIGAFGKIDERLRTGMTARVRIETASIEEATIVPTQAVFARDGQQYCLVFRAGITERRLVTVAADNGVEAAVLGDLAPGEVLLLTEPDITDDYPGS